MALSVLCGLALGLVLNLLADWLPNVSCRRRTRKRYVRR